MPSAPATPEQPSFTPGRWTFFLPWLLVVIGVAVHAGSTGGVWIYDDTLAIVGNEQLRSLAPPWAPPAGNPVSGRPVVGLSLAVNYAAGGLDPRGYHAVNIGIHVLCALVLYGLVRRTLRGPVPRQRFGAVAEGLAFACALLWVIHPVQTECVAYTTQRTESIMALFYLLALYCAVRGAASGRRAWEVAAVIACGLGMASKESMVTAPVMVVLYDWAYRGESFDVKRLLARRGPLYGGLAATWVILAALMLSGPRASTVGWEHGISPWTYALNQCIAITDYLRLAFWPWPLVIDYGAPRPVTFTEAAPYAVVVAGLLLTTAVLFLRRPALGYPAVWFFALLAPTTTVVPIATEVAAERRMYLPLAGLIVFVVVLAWIGLGLAARRAARADALRAGAAIALLVVAAVPLAAATRARNDQYRRPIDLWQAAVEARPDNQRAHLNLGVALADGGRLDEAIAHQRRAIALDPESGMAYFNLGNALFNAGRTREAIDCFRTATRLSPDQPRPHYNLAMALLRAGSTDEEVIAAFGEAVRLEPDNGTARWGRAWALAAKRRAAEALPEYREAVRLMPDNPQLLREAAWMMATAPDPAARNGAEALRLARRAADLIGREDALTLDVLAAACAEAGAFEEAAATARRALLAAQGNPTQAAQLRARLELYEQGRAFHVP